MVFHPDFLGTTLCNINNQNYRTLPELGANFHGKTFKLVDFYSFFFFFFVPLIWCFYRP